MKKEKLCQERLEEFQRITPNPCEDCLLVPNCSEKCNPCMSYEISMIFYAWRPKICPEFQMQVMRR